MFVLTCDKKEAYSKQTWEGAQAIEEGFNNFRGVFIWDFWPCMRFYSIWFQMNSKLNQSVHRTTQKKEAKKKPVLSFCVDLNPTFPSAKFLSSCAALPATHPVWSEKTKTYMVCSRSDKRAQTMIIGCFFLKILNRNLNWLFSSPEHNE